MYYQGTIVNVTQCSGCLEITVTGETPGTFPVDNSCFRMIADCEGIDWMGRRIEYQNGEMRFLDAPDASDDASDPSRDTIPFPDPTCSTRHI